MGEKTSGIIASIAKSVGEEKEFERFWMIVEAFQRLFENDPDADAVRRRLAAIFSSRTTPEGLLTRKELMALWRVSKQMIQSYEKGGLPIALKVGRRPRYRLAEVEAWREGHSQSEKGREGSIGGSRGGTRRVRLGKSGLSGKSTAKNHHFPCGCPRATW